MNDNVTMAASASAAPNGKTKITTKDPALKLAHKRLTVLQLAESLGNVSEACRRGGLDRTSFYEYKRRFQTPGIEGPRLFSHEALPVGPKWEDVQRLIASTDTNDPHDIRDIEIFQKRRFFLFEDINLHIQLDLARRIAQVGKGNLSMRAFRGDPAAQTHFFTFLKIS